MTERIVGIIDNEPFFVDALRLHLEGSVDRPLSVIGYGKPREIPTSPTTPRLTHAVVDVSFGPFDLASADMAPEEETAVDALLHLSDLAPRCRSIVTTVLAGDLAKEVAIVVRQTWPEVRILNKNDGRVADQIAGFVRGEPMLDNAEWGRLVSDIEPIPPTRIVDAVRMCAETRPVASVALALARFDTQPTGVALADALDLSHSRVSNLLTLLGSTLRATGAAELEFATNGLELWGWARPRRPLLERHLRPLV